MYNLHRSPYYWDRPNEFEPERFLIPYKNDSIEGWGGFDPWRSLGTMYPNEVCHLFIIPFCWSTRFMKSMYMAVFTWTDNFRLCISTFWWRSSQVRRGSICADGVECGSVNAAAEIWRWAQRLTGGSRTCYRCNYSHKKWTVVQN